MRPQAIITLKGLPEKDEDLRERHKDMAPIYPMNKKHRHSIALCHTVLTNEGIEQLYQRVWAIYQPKFITQNKPPLFIKEVAAI